MISSTQWTWVWANSGRWWKTGKPGVPQTMVLQRVRHHWETEQQAYFCHGSPVHTWEVWLCMLYKSIFCLPLMLSLWAPHWSLNTIKFWSPAVNLALFLYPETSTYIFSFNQDTFSLSDYSSVWETGRHWFVMQEAGLLDRGPERKGKIQVLSPTRWGWGWLWFLWLLMLTNFEVFHIMLSIQILVNIFPPSVAVQGHHLNFGFYIKISVDIFEVFLWRQSP